MKQHISVLGLFARSSLWKVMAVLLLMSGVEIFFFEKELQAALTAHAADVGLGFPQLERLLDRGAANVWFALAFVLITLLLVLPGCEFRARSGYTLRRLSVGEVSIFLWQLSYNIFVYFLMVVWQTVLCYGLCMRYVALAPSAAVSGQTLFLAFYRSELLHALLPMADVALWLRNLFLLAALGISSAIFPCKQRAGKYSGGIVALAAYAVVFFERGIGEFSQLAIAVCVWVVAICEPVSFFINRDREEVATDETE